MADDNGRLGGRKIDKQIDNISNNIDSLYQSNYNTRIDNSKNMNNIVDNINSDIDDIVNKINGKEISDISSLYIRLFDKESRAATSTTKQINDSIADLIENSSLINNVLNFDQIRKSVQAENYQYDMICRFMPKLEDALEIMKDNVLSSDNFTKDFINITSGRTDKNYITKFNDRAILLKDKYDIQERIEDIYIKTSKYGEYFLYEVPYKKAYERLLQRKQRLSMGIKYESLIDASDPNSIQALTESTKGLSSEEEKKFGDLIDEIAKDEGDFKVNLILDDTGIAYQPIENVLETAKILDSNKSLNEAFYSEAETSTEGNIVNEKLDGVEFADGLLSNDGIISTDNMSKEKVNEIPGAVLAELERENVIPVYMDTTVLGYIYLHVENDYVQEIVMNGNTYNTLTNNTKLLTDDFDRQNDILVARIAGMMADKINAKFINANVDLKEEIYSVLRYNDKFCTTHGTNNITASFLPAEDVHHFYFRLNNKTHRGISDLERSLSPAMIYCMLYLNNAIATVSRTGDKRIYYVKQNVEQNVARTLLNVITQLKKGNMGMRQLTTMNTIFNVVGKFNDHVIPVSQSGDHPIEFEVMSGQNVDTPTDLMDRMEDMAVSATDVPTEFVQSVQSVDYATRFTMSNSKFLRKVYKRQRKCQDDYTIMFRKLYNFEFNDNDMSIKVLLPAPAYLSMSNMQQLMNNAKDQASGIADMIVTDEDEKVKQRFINKMMKNILGTYIDFSSMEELLVQARIEVAVEKDDPDISDTEDEGY